ncbi:MAG: tolB protein precursor [Mucilaginibacter sp.]|uniref:tolB protein precursor n=1 Tax=Mucilaginibacter sp. TaxID=1882438 RepID=UPI0034E46AFB
MEKPKLTRYPFKKLFCTLCCIFGILFLLPKNSDAQYFGQNKVRYKNLKFKVYKTPHFEIYYYLKNDSVIKRFAQESELWYTIHQQVFQDTFRKANPIILYADHPDFEQTTAIQGEIGVGTGGVTEGLKNRVVMPLMETSQTTRHVIGHELVHAFQYHTLLDNNRAQGDVSSINNLPLWMIEGMAEYLSLGKKDAYTAMWMRDAYLNKDIPTLKDLTTSSKYFPYRYGEAFWSFVGSTYGDSVIVPFFKNTAHFGLEYGIRRTFGYDEKTLSSLWKNSIEATYKPYLKDTLQVPVGMKVIDDKNSGKMNVAPAISPDGKYIAFLSEKNLFSIDLYLADAKTGRILRKLTSKVSNTHIDEFNFIESAGTWSPDSKRFAFSVFNEGRNKLVIVDANSGRVMEESSMKKAKQFSNLSWSPNGNDIVFNALAEGQSDLYLYNISTKTVTQITNDKYTDYQPSFSHDGKKIVFTSDRTTYDQSLAQTIPFNLAVYDLATKTTTDITIFNGANNLNPAFSADDKSIYFLSNRDGFRNMYRYNLSSATTEQMTNLFTGISGITEFSPALSLSANNDVVYSYYRAQKYTIYNAKVTDFKPVAVENQAINFDAALLPPPKSVGVDLINTNLNNFLAYQKIPTDSIHNIPFKPQFKLDYLASSGVGAGVSRYGAGLASGIQGLFSDIIGRNQIYAGAAVNGQIYDFGAQLAYINQQGRWNFGVSASHIPFQYATYQEGITNISQNNKPVSVYESRYDITRTFQDALQVFTSYPFSKVTRIEFGTGASQYYYRVDRYSTYYNYVTTNNNLQITNGLYSEHEKISRAQYFSETGYDLMPFSLFQLNTALVGDNSYFGVASPLEGYRYRIGIEGNVGSYKFLAPTIDLRKYVRTKPVTFAGRIYGYGRIGDNSQALFPLFIGYPYLIRGYEANSFYNNNARNKGNFTIDQLQGSRTAVANFEVRLPFTGPEKLSQIKSKFLFTELNFFFDAGLAWNAGDKIAFKKEPDANQYLTDASGNPVYSRFGQLVYPSGYNRVPAFSTGISLRINLFGAFVLEPYLAIPFQRTDVQKPVLGLTFAPGW